MAWVACVLDGGIVFNSGKVDLHPYPLSGTVPWVRVCISFIFV